MSKPQREEDHPTTYDQKYEQDNEHVRPVVVANPLAQPLSRQNELYRRLKLFPWWLRYNIGVAEEAVLKD
ncbi:MAG: hypothetical protein WCF06_16055, partial [Nitrososphaeraceae archaeon]